MANVVILARGGSKGIPRKNLQLVAGETLIARCVKTCSDYNVIVSTDSHEIAQEGARCGADIHWRSAVTSNDTATHEAALIEVRNDLSLTGTIACVQCTAPFLTRADLRNSIVVCETTDSELVVVSTRFHGFILQQIAKRYECVNHELLPPPRRQDMPPQYLISGSVWAFDATYLDQPFYSGELAIVEAECPIQIEIDTQADLNYVRQILRSESYA